MSGLDFDRLEGFITIEGHGAIELRQIREVHNCRSCEKRAASTDKSSS
jgi:hypothetical protein